MKAVLIDVRKVFAVRSFDWDLDTETETWLRNSKNNLSTSNNPHVHSLQPEHNPEPRGLLETLPSSETPERTALCWRELCLENVFFLSLPLTLRQKLSENLQQTVPVEGDELRRFLHQRFGHMGHAPGHGRLADPYRVPHGRLE